MLNRQSVTLQSQHLQGEQTIDGRIDHHANQNGTARIHGGPRLRAWFQAHLQVMESLAVDLNSPDLIQFTHGDR